MMNHEITLKITSGIQAILTKIKDNSDELRSVSSLSGELQAKVDGLSNKLNVLSDSVAVVAETTPVRAGGDTTDIWDHLQPALTAVHTAESSIHEQLSDFTDVIEELRAEHRTLGALRQEIHTKNQLIRIKDELIEMLKAPDNNKANVS